MKNKIVTVIVDKVLNSPGDFRIIGRLYDLKKREPVSEDWEVYWTKFTDLDTGVPFRNYLPSTVVTGTVCEMRVQATANPDYSRPYIPIIELINLYSFSGAERRSTGSVPVWKYIEKNNHRR